jgi:hypothetical protein
MEVAMVVVYIDIPFTDPLLYIKLQIHRIYRLQTGNLFLANVKAEIWTEA